MYHKLSAALLILLSLLSCNPDKLTKVDQGKVTFATDDASKLFFKNIRQLYYDLEEMEVAKLKVFRLKKRDLSTEQPIINLALVDNWRYDEAYLLLEPNQLLANQDALMIKWISGENSGEIIYQKGNKIAQVTFADQIYEQVQLGSALSIKVNNSWTAFLDTEKSREAFRITMFDYYRLVKRI